MRQKYKLQNRSFLEIRYEFDAYAEKNVTHFFSSILSPTGGQPQVQGQMLIGKSLLRGQYMQALSSAIRSPQSSFYAL